jgi:hypothetical protein
MSSATPALSTCLSSVIQKWMVFQTTLICVYHWGVRHELAREWHCIERKEDIAHAHAHELVPIRTTHAMQMYCVTWATNTSRRNQANCTYEVKQFLSLTSASIINTPRLQKCRVVKKVYAATGDSKPRFLRPKSSHSAKHCPMTETGFIQYDNISVHTTNYIIQ